MPYPPTLDPEATFALLQAVYLRLGLSFEAARRAAGADYTCSYAPVERMAA